MYTISDYAVAKLEALKMLVLQDSESPNRLRAEVDAVVNEVQTVELAECTFEGLVLVIGFDGVEAWECPLCRADHEVEVEAPEPDDPRDE